MKNEQLASPESPKSFKNRLGRYSAYGFSVLALTGAPAGAKAFEAPNAKQAYPTAIVPNTVGSNLFITEAKNPPKPGEVDYKSNISEIKRAIEAINRSKKANLFYGAVMVEDVTYPVKGGIKTTLYASPEKTRRGRFSIPMGGPVAFIIPTYAEIHGNPFLIGYHHNSLAPSDHVDKNAGTTDIYDLTSYYFLDLNEARERGLKFTYFAFIGEKPRMLHTKVFDGVREIKENVPPYAMPGEARSHYLNPERVIQDLSSYSLVPISNKFKPPF